MYDMCLFNTEMKLNIIIVCLEKLMDSLLLPEANIFQELVFNMSSVSIYSTGIQLISTTE